MSKINYQKLEKKLGEIEEERKRLLNKEYKDKVAKDALKALQHNEIFLNLLMQDKIHEFLYEVKKFHKGGFSDKLFATETIKKYALENYGNLQDYFAMHNFRRGMDKHIETTLLLNKEMTREEIAFFLCNRESEILAEMAEEEKKALRYKRSFINDNAERIKTETLAHMGTKK